MKHSRFVITALLAITCFFTSGRVFAQSPATGTITGRVSNAGTGNYLAAVEVKDLASGRSVFTDSEGNYELFGLPAGERKLAFNYSGLDPQEVTVSVTSGERVAKDIALSSADYSKEIIQLEKFVVAGEREGRSASIAQQKASNVLVDVISSDEFPNVAGGNIGDFLRNLPGISIDYSGADPRSISMRGMDSEMTAVTVNGMRSANAASGSGDRTFELSTISLQDVESVEIFKTPTAAHDADSGSGIVNMKSKSAFTLKGRRIQFQAGGSGNSGNFNLGRTWHADGEAYSIRPSGNFSYQNSFLRNRLGVTFTANLNDIYTRSTRSQNNYQTDTTLGPITGDGWGLDGDTGLPVIYPRNMSYSIGGGFSRRTSFSLNFDYRLTPFWTLKSTNQVNTSLGRSVTPSLSFNSSYYRADASIDGTRSGIIRDGLTPESSTAVTAGGSIRANTLYDAADSLSDTYSSIGAEILQKVEHGTTFGLGAEYKRDKWWINIQGAASQSSARYGTPNNMPYSQATFYLRGIDYRIDDPAGSDYPMPTQLNGISVYDLANYVSRGGTNMTANVAGTGMTMRNADNSMVVVPGISTDVTYPIVKRESGNFGPAVLQNSRWRTGKDKRFGGKLDLRRRFMARGILSNMYAQTGGAYSEQERTRSESGRTRWIYNGSTEELSDMLRGISSTHTDSFGPYQSVPYFSFSALNNYFKANPDKLTEDVVYRTEREGSQRMDYREKIPAVYAQFNTSFWSRLNILAGVRWEQTTQQGTGTVLNQEASRSRAMEMMMEHVRGYGYADITSAWNDTAVNPLSGMSGRDMVNNYTVTQAQALELARLSYTESSLSNSFSDWYPNLQVKYTLTPNLIMRAAYNKSIGRQRFEHLLPGYTVSVDSNNNYSLTMNNPELKPVYFDNYDIALEYYTKNGGNLKFGWFRKEVTNYTQRTTILIEPGQSYGGYDFSEYAGSELSWMSNVGGAKQWGIEASFSQRLSILHHSLRYFSAMGSYTYQKGRADAAFDGTLSAATLASLPGSLPVKSLVPKMFMLGLSYDRTPVKASIKYNWKDDYYDGAHLYTDGARYLGYRYRKARGTLDVSFSYRLYRKYNLFAEARNILDEPDVVYLHNPNWIYRYDRYGAAIYFGVKATL
jgi:TonB-dependent receptor